MRVVGGVWRGRPLRAPGGRTTRPTSDRVREAVFDVVEDLLGTVDEARDARLAGQRVLDLFAGSGALGIEALSRGAAQCTFVERGRPALEALQANLAAVGVEVLRRRTGAASPPASAAVAAMPALPTPPAATDTPARDAPVARLAAFDVRRALAADARAGEMYTLVLADPPYARYGEFEGDLVRLLAPLLAPGALVVLETRRDQALSLPWPCERFKRYGDTQVAFMVAGAGPPASTGPPAGEGGVTP